MVDYSKWDKLDLSDEEEPRPKRPVVSKFESPMSVTIGGDGMTSSEAAADVEMEPWQRGKKCLRMWDSAR
eukprot:g31723.t1